MSCLLIKNDGLGDLVLCSGIISRLAAHFNGDLDLVTCEQNTEIAEMIPGIRRLFYVSRTALIFDKQWSKAGLLVRRPTTDIDRKTLKDIESLHYDVAISLRRFMTQSTLILMRAVKAAEKRCMWQYPTNATYRQARRSSKGWRHYCGPVELLWEPAYYQRFARDCLGIELDATPLLNLGVPRLQENNDEKRVALGVAGKSKRWPHAYWIKLATMLKDDGWNLTLLGGRDSLRDAVAISEKTGANNLVATLNIKQTIEALSEHRYYIGYDTGLSHIASLLCKKTVVILGGGTFRRFFPWPEQENQYVVYGAMDCFDCFWQCKSSPPECLARVAPEDVYRYFLQVVQGTAHAFRNLNDEPMLYTPAWRHAGRTN